jgi:hypothetical protein
MKCSRKGWRFVDGMVVVGFLEQEGHLALA